jgi:hypothetical protein
MGVRDDHLQVAMRLARSILAVALLTGGVLAWASAVAQAGTFPVEACTSSVSYANHSWLFSTNNPTYIESHTVCGEPPVANNPPKLVNVSLGDSLGAGGVPVGAKGAWTFTALPGTTISDVHGVDQLMKVGGNNGWNVYLSSQDTEGHDHVAQTCATSAFENECGVGGPFDVPGLKATTMSIGAECDAEEYEPGRYFTTCARGNEFGHATRAEIDEATVMINDPTPPSNVTGSDIPAGAQHGTITIQGSATDTIAGLVSLSVIDKNNKTIGGPITVPGGCDYSQMTPCPTDASSVSVPVNTEELPDGTNEIRVVAINAAQDQETSPAYTITVENHPTSGGGGGGGDGGGGGTGGSGGGSTGGTGGSGSTNQGGGATSSHEEPPATKPEGSSLLPSLPLRLTNTRVKHHELLLYGSGPLSNAVVWVTLRAHGHEHHPWTVQRKVRLTRRRFRCSLRIPSGWQAAHATLELLYKGGAVYRRTRLQRNIRI